jgi:hypothetical protein
MKTEELGEKPAPLPLGPPRIPWHEHEAQNICIYLKI